MGIEESSMNTKKCLVSIPMTDWSCNELKRTFCIDLTVTRIKNDEISNMN